MAEQLLPKIFFRFGHFYFFANLFMGYINNIVMKNFSFHSTIRSLLVKNNTQNFANAKICDFLYSAKEHQMQNKM